MTDTVIQIKLPFLWQEPRFRRLFGISESPASRLSRFGATSSKIRVTGARARDAATVHPATTTAAERPRAGSVSSVSSVEVRGTGTVPVPGGPETGSEVSHLRNRGAPFKAHGLCLEFST